MHTRIGNQCDGHQRLASSKPYVAHEDDDGVVVDMQEGYGFGLSRIGEDEEGVEEFVELGEVEDVGPEEDRARGGGGLVEGEAEEVGEGGEGEEGGEGGGEGENEGEEEEDGIVEGGEEVEEGRGECNKWVVTEEESEGEVGEDG